MADVEPQPLADGLCLIEDLTYPGTYLFDAPNTLVQDPDYPDFYQIGS